MPQKKTEWKAVVRPGSFLAVAPTIAKDWPQVTKALTRIEKRLTLIEQRQIKMKAPARKAGGR